MKLTTRTEYALLALVYLGRAEPDTYVAVETIARAQDIPPKFLEQILLTMKRARILTSVKGQHGGYKLNRPPGEITLAEVVRLYDGALAPTDSVSENFYEPTPIEREENLVKVFKDIRNFISQKLETTTLKDIC